MADIYKAVDWAITIAQDAAHGYDQEHRNGPDYDCSSFVSTALAVGGFDISCFSWTGNMLPQLLGQGFTQIPLEAERKAGDIFLNVRHHVVMCIDRNQIVQASINENGGITGGRTGDQTGHEIAICPFYWYTHGWDYHLRPPKESYLPQDPPKQRRKVVIKVCRG